MINLILHYFFNKQSSSIIDRSQGNLFVSIEDIEQYFTQMVYKMVYQILFNMKSVLEPIQVDYAPEVLSTQIVNIALILLILSIIIIILIMFFVFNTFVFVYSNRLLERFKNKYIKLYINISRKFIAIELGFLACAIIYFMFSIIKGLLFIIKHPVF